MANPNDINFGGQLTDAAITAAETLATVGLTADQLASVRLPKDLQEKLDRESAALFACNPDQLESGMSRISWNFDSGATSGTFGRMPMRMTTIWFDAQVDNPSGTLMKGDAGGRSTLDSLTTFQPVKASQPPWRLSMRLKPTVIPGPVLMAVNGDSNGYVGFGIFPAVSATTWYGVPSGDHPADGATPGTRVTIGTVTGGHDQIDMVHTGAQLRWRLNEGIWTTIVDSPVTFAGWSSWVFALFGGATARAVIDWLYYSWQKID